MTIYRHQIGYRDLFLRRPQCYMRPLFFSYRQGRSRYLKRFRTMSTCMYLQPRGNMLEGFHYYSCRDLYFVISIPSDKFQDNSNFGGELSEQYKGERFCISTFMTCSDFPAENELLWSTSIRKVSRNQYIDSLD